MRISRLELILKISHSYFSESDKSDRDAIKPGGFVSDARQTRKRKNGPVRLLLFIGRIGSNYVIIIDCASRTNYGRRRFPNGKHRFIE